MKLISYNTKDFHRNALDDFVNYCPQEKKRNDYDDN